MTLCEKTFAKNCEKLVQNTARRGKYDAVVGDAAEAVHKTWLTKENAKFKLRIRQQRQ